MNAHFSKAPAAAMMFSCAILFTACGGGGADPASSIATPSQPAGAAPAGAAYGPVLANFSIGALSDANPTNATTGVFRGSPAMCDSTVAGSNICLGAAAGRLGNVIPAAGGKCTYLNLGPTQIPRGFDIMFRADDGRTN